MKKTKTAWAGILSVLVGLITFGFDFGENNHWDSEALAQETRIAEQQAKTHTQILQEELRQQRAVSP